VACGSDTDAADARDGFETRESHERRGLKIHAHRMNLSRSFRNYEESLRRIPLNNLNTARLMLIRIIRRIIRPTGLSPFEFERQYQKWLQKSQNLRRHAANRMRKAATSRRTHAMRGQLSSARIQTGSRTVNGIPLGLRNKIASYMRR
jgi:hypothetical protein